MARMALAAEALVAVSAAEAVCADCGLAGVDVAGNVPCPNCGSHGRHVVGNDAGDLCAECGQVITWTTHLPPLEAGQAARCFVDVLAVLPPRPRLRLIDGGRS